MSEVELLKEQVKALTKQAREAMAVADQAGYDKKINQMKALFQRRAERSKLKSRHTAVRSKILKKLKGNQTKKRSGQRRSRMSADVQREVTKIYKLLKSVKTMKQAHKEYVRRIEKDGWQDVDALEMKLLHNLSFVDQSSVDTLEILYKDINDLISVGKAEGFFGQMLQWKAEVKPKVLTDILGPAPAVSLEQIRQVGPKAVFENLGLKDRIKRQLSDMTLGHDFIFGYRGLLEMVAQESPNGIHQSDTVKELDTYDAEERYRTEMREDNDTFLKSYQDVFGIEKWENALRSLWKDAVPTADFKGMLWSKGELRYLWLLFRDPTLTKRLENQGYTDKDRAKVNTLLDEKDKEFAKKMSEYWNNGARFQETGDVYERVMGAPLTSMGPMYAPVNALAPAQAENEVYSLLDMDKNAPQFVEDYRIRASAETTGHIKERAKSDNIRVETKRNLISVARAYAEEMAHFRNLAIPIRKANAIFTDAEIRDAIIATRGPDVYNSLMDNIAGVAQSGQSTRDSIRYVDAVRTSFIFSKIALSIPTFLKQHISMLNWMDKMPVGKFIEGTVKFFENTHENYKEIAELNSTKNRATLLERDFAEMTKVPEYRTLLKDPTFLNWMLWLLRTGDRNGVSIGGWVYREYLMTPEGGSLTKAKANREVGFTSNMTQQSGMTSELSNLQRGNSWAKLVTMWSTGPTQAMRLEIESSRAYGKRRIPFKQFAKTMFIYHVLIPQMYALIANTIKSGVGGGEWDWWDHKLALAFGPLGNAMIIGRMMQKSVSYMLGGSPLADSSPFETVTRDISRAGRKMAKGDWDKISIEDGAKLLEGILILSKQGAPVVRGERMVKGAIEMSKGNPREGFVHLMGQTPPKKLTVAQRIQRERRKSREK